MHASGTQAYASTGVTHTCEQFMREAAAAAKHCLLGQELAGADGLHNDGHEGVVGAALRALQARMGDGDMSTKVTSMHLLWDCLNVSACTLRGPGSAVTQNWFHLPRLIKEESFPLRTPDHRSAVLRDAASSTEYQNTDIALRTSSEHWP